MKTLNGRTSGSGPWRRGRRTSWPRSASGRRRAGSGRTGRACPWWPSCSVRRRLQVTQESENMRKVAIFIILWTSNYLVTFTLVNKAWRLKGAVVAYIFGTLCPMMVDQCFLYGFSSPPVNSEFLALCSWSNATKRAWRRRVALCRSTGRQSG